MLCEYRLINSGAKYSTTQCHIDSYALLKNCVMLKSGKLIDIIPYNNLAYLRLKEEPDDDMKILEKGASNEFETSEPNNKSDS